MLRAGYSINYVDDNNIATVNNSAVTNSGLQTAVGFAGLSGTLSNGRPAIPTPSFHVPRTAADNYAINPAANAMGMVDPNLRTPYIQQWNLGMEQRFQGYRAGRSLRWQSWREGGSRNRLQPVG